MVLGPRPLRLVFIIYHRRMLDEFASHVFAELFWHRPEQDIARNSRNKQKNIYIYICTCTCEYRISLRSPRRRGPGQHRLAAGCLRSEALSGDGGQGPMQTTGIRGQGAERQPRTALSSSENRAAGSGPSAPCLACLAQAEGLVHRWNTQNPSQKVRASVSVTNSSLCAA